MRTIYLAGPDVFFPNAKQHALRKIDICLSMRFDAYAPLDDALTTPETIYDKNLRMMRTCDLCIANLTPFRGPSADAGTIFEVGWFIGAGKPVYGYTTSAQPFDARTQAFLATWPDPAPFATEGFGMLDNLMIPLGITRTTGGTIAVPEHDLPYDDLTMFQRVVGIASGMRFRIAG